MLAKAPLTFGSAEYTRLTFKAAVSLRGTSSFKLYTAAKELNATIRSSWPSPSFIGTVLPDTSNVAADGFEARWKTTEFGSPRVTTGPVLGDSPTLASASIGVDLIEATPIYRMINRVAKYGLLFIVLSFATYFFFEVLSRLRIHVVQYGMLGLSLSLFSLLLLSFAEPLGYTNAYLASASLVLAQATLYTAAVARRFKPAFLFALMLASLFAFIYVLLGLETYSLLIGALALFAVVSVLMVLTQMINLPGRLSSAPA
jgi:inner membrane protein